MLLTGWDWPWCSPVCVLSVIKIRKRPIVTKQILRLQPPYGAAATLIKNALADLRTVPVAAAALVLVSGRWVHVPVPMSGREEPAQH